MKLDDLIYDGIQNTLDERLSQYTSDLKKLAFDKQKMPSIEKAISTVESIHGRLIKFEIFRKNKI